MSWSIFGSKNKNSGSSQTNLQAHRAKQIDSLKKAKLNPLESIPNTEYRIPFKCGQSSFQLVVTLPPLFPQDPPMIVLNPPAMHPWLDGLSKVVGCPALNAFSMHSSLANVVQSILDEFKRNPPQLGSQNFGAPGGMPYPGPTPGLSMPPPPVSGYTPPYISAPQYNSPSLPPSQILSSSSSSTDIQPPGRRTPTNNDYTVPDVNVAFPELSSKSLTQLNEMLNEEEKILEMIQKLPEVCRLQEVREEISNECIQLARDNLSKKPAILQMKQQVSDRQSLLRSAQQEFESDQRKLMSMSDQFHPTNIQTNLKVALMEAEEESENIVEELLSKKVDIDEFTQRFIKTRTLCHSRRAKDEKLNQIILQHGY
ncbi:hypothetical protein FSP39_022103 [Pinctada imbricata]|uniref:VPS37 C-terminal domain-containing protein n=1 Tax=Pinctada imbricata TaxID=66713 RepID=A0AA89BXV5_PINIB|nr:hypothetical protein FSP39_022103 [Pinctada imbricata]